MENKRNQEKNYKIIANHAKEGKLIRLKKDHSYIGIARISKGIVYRNDNLTEFGVDCWETIEEIPFQEKQYKVIADHAQAGKLVRLKKDHSIIKECIDIMYEKASVKSLENNIIQTTLSKEWETIEEIPSKVYTIDDLRVGMRIQTIMSGIITIKKLENHIVVHTQEINSTEYNNLTIDNLLHNLNTDRWSIVEEEPNVEANSKIELSDITGKVEIPSRIYTTEDLKIGVQLQANMGIYTIDKIESNLIYFKGNGLSPEPIKKVLEYLNSTWSIIQPSKFYNVDDLRVGMKIQTNYNSGAIVEIKEFICNKERVLYKYPYIGDIVEHILNNLNSGKWTVVSTGIIKDIEEIPSIKTSRPNVKQFKEFSDKLFEAYFDKFTPADKIKAIQVIISNMNISEISIAIENGKPVLDYVK